MRRLFPIVLAFTCSAFLLVPMAAQPPGAKDYSDSSIVTRMMAFNKKKDGKLTKEEVTDTRLYRLFDLADANKDGVVTREELTALAAKLDAEWGQDKGFGGPGGKGPGGLGGPGGKGFGGFGLPPAPGQVLPLFIRDQLNLSADQKRQIEDLQKDVDSAIQKILTDTQKKRLQEMRDRGPGGFGPPGGKGPPPPDGPDR
jgi:hypothetical protein